MRVTVSGASGTIGLACVDMLVRAGHAVRAFVRDPALFRARCADGRVEVVEGDASDRTAVGLALEAADAAIYCVDFPARQFHLHWDATRYTLEALGHHGRLVMPGNDWVYQPEGDERLPPDPPKQSPARLGAVRADLEKAILAEGGTVVHLPEVYGPRVWHGRLASAFERALSGKRVRFPGDPDRRLELLYIDDAARALIAPLGRTQAAGAEYTAPGHAETTPRQFISLIFQAAGQPVRFRSYSLAWLRAVSLLDGDRRARRDLLYLQEQPILLDGTRIRSELGWTPEVGYVDGVRRTLKWLRAQRATTLSPAPAPDQRSGPQDAPPQSIDAPAPG